MQPSDTLPAPSLGSSQLAAAIARRGLSQKAAGALVGQSQQQMQRLVNGLRKPGLAAALRIRDVFEVEPEAWSKPPPSKRRAA